MLADTSPLYTSGFRRRCADSEKRARTTSAFGCDRAVRDLRDETMRKHLRGMVGKAARHVAVAPNGEWATLPGWKAAARSGAPGLLRQVAENLLSPVRLAHTCRSSRDEVFPRPLAQPSDFTRNPSLPRRRPVCRPAVPPGKRSRAWTANAGDGDLAVARRSVPEPDSRDRRSAGRRRR